MLWLYRYIKGYLLIKISGANAYELINKSSFSKTPIFCCRYVKGEVLGYITVENFKFLRKNKRGVKCKIKILKKYGLPFIIARYKNRYGILLGLIIFFVFLQFMSGFIWNIDVVGNKKITDNEILTVCNQMGICEGTKKSKINTIYSAQQLLLENENLAWCSLNIENCNLTVNVTEIKKKNEEKKFSNLIATDDGIVEKIDVTSGNVLVKVGQEVKEGDILVSGIIEKADETLFLASKGQIFVKQTKEFEYKEKYTQEKTVLKGKDINVKNINIFGIRIPISLKNTSKCKQINIEEKALKILGKKLPLSIVNTKYKLQEKENVDFSEIKLLEKIDIKCQEDIKKLDAVSVVENNSSSISKEDFLLVNKTFTLVRDIAVTQEIIIESSN